jgi:dinuclear metal center YbgI/SA1388 family protein
VRIGDFYEMIDTAAPFDLQEEYDNAGIITGSPDDQVRAVLLCLDAVTGTVEEARRKGANLMIVHHPPIFRPIKRLDAIEQAALLAAVRLDIAILAAHTNYDAAADGLNAYVVGRMGLEDPSILEVSQRARHYKIVTFVPREFRERVLQAMFSAGAGRVGGYSETSFCTAGTGSFRPEEGTHPFVGQQGELTHVEEDRIETIVQQSRLTDALVALRQVHPYEEPAIDVFEERLLQAPAAGFGHVGNLPRPLSGSDFIQYVKTFFGVSSVPVAGVLPDTISRIAFCSGAGTSLLASARRAGAQVLISGDLKYHEALDAAQSGGCMVVVDHYSTERFFGEAMEKTLTAVAHSRGEELPALYRSDEEYQPVHVW